MGGFGLLLPIASSATWGSLSCIPELNEGFGLGFFGEGVEVWVGFFSVVRKCFFLVDRIREEDGERNIKGSLTAVHLYQSVSLSYC